MATFQTGGQVEPDHAPLESPQIFSIDPPDDGATDAAAAEARAYVLIHMAFCSASNIAR